MMVPNKDKQMTSEEASNIHLPRTHDDRWIQIQKNTFTNWINEQLKKDIELNDTIIVNDLQLDLSNGIILIRLINLLQHPYSKVPKKYFKKPLNQHQCLENITLALNAILADGIRLVNIGNTDIHAGNLKLILGLIWHLILRYQIGKTKIPPKKLILAWLKSVLPDCRFTNLTQDLNDGLIIAGLVNYCDESLLKDWRQWDRANKIENCRLAMSMAYEKLNIPLVVTPENMSSPELDELSSITYISYFMKEDSPGYLKTLNIIQNLLPDEKITNFNTDWNDGWLLCKLVNKMGANIREYPNLNRTRKEYNCQLGIDGCRQLKIDTYLTAKELSDPDVEYLGVMSTLVQFKYIKPIKQVNEKAHIKIDLNEQAIVGKLFEFEVEYDEDKPLNTRAFVKGPNSSPSIGQEKLNTNCIRFYFTPAESGLHEIVVKCDDVILNSCPININVIPDLSKIQIGVNERIVEIYDQVEICVNPMGAGKGKVVCKAKSPLNELIELKIEEKDLKYYSKLIPTEIGKWFVHVYYDNIELNSSPLIIDTFNLKSINIETNEKQKESYKIKKEISFKVNTSNAGNGNFKARLLDSNENVEVNVEQMNDVLYRISFIPLQIGIHKCSIMFNNKEIKGSPIEFNIVGESQQVSVHFDDAKSVQLNTNISFMIETRDNYEGDIKVISTSPSGDRVALKVTREEQDKWKVEFKPTSEIGEYYIDVYVSNQLIQESPFKLNVFDSNKIILKPVNFGFINKQVNFEVDASYAGTGQLEISVSNGRIPCTFTNNGNLIFIPSFIPIESGDHSVSVKFNGHEVPNSPFNCHIIDSAKINISQEDKSKSLRYPINKENSIELITYESIYYEKLNAKLVTPNENSLPVKITQQTQSSIRVHFQSNEIGTHSLIVEFHGIPIFDLPLEIKIYDSAKIYISDIKGLEMNKQSEFIIDASQAGEGQLEIAINDGLVKNNVKQIRQGCYSVSFVATKLEYYTIECKFNGELVPGCPKKVQIRDSTQIKLLTQIKEHALYGVPTSFKLGNVIDLNQLDIKIIKFNGEQLIHKVQSLGQDEYKIEWIPLDLDPYTISIKYAQQTIKDSPFKVKVYDPKKVEVIDLYDGLVFKEYSFKIDASQAGEGSLEIGIKCNGQFIPNQVKTLGNSKFQVHFVPQEARIHYAYINFNGEQIKNSPFEIRISEENKISIKNANNLIPLNISTTFDIITYGYLFGQLTVLIKSKLILFSNNQKNLSS